MAFFKLFNAIFDFFRTSLSQPQLEATANTLFFYTCLFSFFRPVSNHHHDLVQQLEIFKTKPAVALNHSGDWLV